MKEEDIRKRDILNKYLELVRIDSEHFFQDKTSFHTILCPACESNNYRFEFEKYGFSYVQCTECDTLYVNPRPSYGQLIQIYINSPSTKFWVNEFFLPMADARREKIFKPRAQYISEKFPQLKAGTIGDIGAGFGIFIEELKKIWPDTNIIAIEPSVEMALICRNNGLKVIQSAMEDIDPFSMQFDLLTAFEIFEHLHNPGSFLEKTFALLKKHGYLYLTTLNGLGFDIQLLWENSKSVMPPHHLNFFNPNSIKILLEKKGFKVVEITTPGKLDWDIVEGSFIYDSIDPCRFFKTVSKYGSDEAKKELQLWISKNGFSSHMSIIAKKG